jgi:hypothetical protein
MFFKKENGLDETCTMRGEMMNAYMILVGIVEGQWSFGTEA